MHGGCPTVHETRGSGSTTGVDILERSLRLIPSHKDGGASSQTQGDNYERRTIRPPYIIDKEPRKLATEDPTGEGVPHASLETALSVLLHMDLCEWTPVQGTQCTRSMYIGLRFIRLAQLYAIKCSPLCIFSSPLLQFKVLTRHWSPSKSDSGASEIYILSPLISAVSHLVMNLLVQLSDDVDML